MHNQPPARNLLAMFALLVLTGAPAHAPAQVSPAMCGSLQSSFGPYDYRPNKFSPEDGKYEATLQIVERFHFTAPVENLIRGASTTRPGGDIEYTLKAFPNHHRALISVLRLWEREKKQPRLDQMSLPLECYFERAVRFRPDDNVARLLYATFLLKDNRKDDAVTHLEIARVSGEDNAFTQYNIGLVYADAAMYDEALRQAHRAMSLGLARQHLADRLRSVGRWKDPGELAPMTPMNPASAAAVSGGD